MDVVKLVDDGRIPEEHINGYLDTLGVSDVDIYHDGDPTHIKTSKKKYLTDDGKASVRHTDL